MVRQIPEAVGAGIAGALAALRDGNPERAEAIVREELARAPDSVDHLRLLGRALAMQSRAGEAEEVVRQALALAPSLAALHEDLGGILAMQGRFEDAVSCFETALKSDPRLPFARKKLGEALAALGRGPEADKAFEGWFEQDSDRVYVAVALDHLQAGRRVEGISNLRKAIRANPDNVDALFALAQAYRGNEQRNSDIEAMLRRVNEIAPAHVSAWALLGSLLHETDRTEEAIACYLRVVELEPANVGGWSGLGAAYARIGNVAKGAEAYKRSIVLQPDLPGTHMSLAHELKTLGKQTEALREYRAAIALKPDFGEAYWSMANLKVFRFEPAEVTAMEEQLKREDLSEGTNVHFRFALGKAYEDAGDYDRAWEYYETGNQRQRPLVSYDPVGFESRHEEIAEVFSREFLEKHAGEGFESDAPIFIVGLPRSGSTLIEQILSSHSQVEGPSSWRRSARSRSRPVSIAATTASIPEPCANSGPRLPRFRKAIHRRDASLSNERQAAIHGQAAEQFLPCRFRSPHPAEREDHQRAAPSARQPARQLQAAFRQGAELHL